MYRNKFCLKSMGCKSNQYEGAVICQKLLSAGYEQVNDIKLADFYILNSCSVTHKSDNEALYLLRNAKSTNSHIKTILTGCFAQLEPEFISNLGYVDYIFGNDDKFKIVQYLNDNQSQVNDIMSVNEFNYQQLNDFSKTRYSVKIQDGCDNRCAYCVIPFARGKSRSANESFVINQLNYASDNGFKEAVITGIHIGQWGKEWGKSIIDLLKLIEKDTSIYRYRLGSLNPLEITEEMLDFLRDSEKFCPHFHLSLQSACNKTLKAMNRFYTVELYLEQIEYICQIFKNPFLGSDIIAGFVGESDEDFNETVNNLKKSKLSKIHVFPYSVRKNTQAEKMDGQIPDKIKQERADLLKKISYDKYINFINKNIAEECEVLIEKRPGKNTGRLKGMTRNYLEVNIIDEYDDYSIYLNTIRNVRILDYKDRVINAKIID